MVAYGAFTICKLFRHESPSYDKIGFLLRTNLIENSNIYPVLALSVPLACHLQSIFGSECEVVYQGH